jgi:hypothetical protein
MPAAIVGHAAGIDNCRKAAGVINRPGRRRRLLEHFAAAHRANVTSFDGMAQQSVRWNEGIDMKVARLLLTAILALALSERAMAQQAAAGGQAGPAAASQSASDITPTEESPSPWGWLKMPTISMPKISMPKMPADPLAPIKNSARKVGEGGKKAWEGTKEIFTFGGSKAEPQAPRVASAKEPPSMWKRMFGGAKEEKKPEGPATVAEWMAQPRVE